MGGSSSRREYESHSFKNTNPIGGFGCQSATDKFLNTYPMGGFGCQSATDKFLNTNPVGGFGYESELNIFRNTNPIGGFGSQSATDKFLNTNPIGGYGSQSVTEKFLNTNPTGGLGYLSESNKFPNTNPIGGFGSQSTTDIFLNTKPMGRFGYQSESDKFLNTNPIEGLGSQSATDIFLNTNPMGGFGSPSATDKFLNTNPKAGFGLQSETDKFLNTKQSRGYELPREKESENFLNTNPDVSQDSKQKFLAATAHGVGAMISRSWNSNPGKNIRSQELKPGDHIYAWRKNTGKLIAHHGIYMGDDRVVHFNTATGQKSFTDAASCDTCRPWRKETTNGVVVSCLNCFLNGDTLYLYEYSASMSENGRCSTVASDPPEVVLVCANEFIKNGFENYDLLWNNCENFAFYCKTGKYKVSGQLLNAADALLIGTTAGALKYLSG